MGISWEGASEMSPEIGQEIEKVKEFVQRNRVKADNSKLECSDGRYLPEQSQGAIRVFGADFGIIAAIVSATSAKRSSVPPDGIVSRYEVAIEHHEAERDGFLHFHTDDHAQKDIGIGCGHIKRLVNEEGMGDIFKKFKSYKTQEVVLEGKHNEKGVLLVYSDDWSVNSQDPQTSEMFFIVDMKRIKGFIEKITPKLSIPHISADDVWKTYQEQMAQTAKKLAPNQSQFEVEIDSRGEPKVDFIGKVSSSS